MRILIEKNEKDVRGYQLRYQNGPVDTVYSEEVFYDISTAMKHAQIMLDAYNDHYKENLTPKECIAFDETALAANEKYDLNAKRILKQIRKGKFDEVIPSPANAQDIRDANIKIKRTPAKSGNMEKISINITKQGFFMTLLQVIIEKQDDDEEFCASHKPVLQDFCKLLAGKGYGKGATEIEDDLLKMNSDEFVSWFGTVVRHYNISEDQMEGIIANNMKC